MKVFRCPSCHEFIAADATKCRFCSAPIDAETAKSAVAAQEKENKRYRRKQYARHIFIGIGVFALGLLFMAAYPAESSSPHGGFTYALILGGLGDFVYGLAGWLGELK
jgi:predicted nucleic acid-binding Zn ribbon protein